MFLLRLLPEDTQRHLLAARKERLLAVRSVLDRWIEKTEARQEATSQERGEAAAPARAPSPRRRGARAAAQESGAVDVEAERMQTGE